MKKKSRAATGCPFVNPPGLDCSTPAGPGTVGRWLRRSHTATPTVPEAPHSQEQASDACLN